MSCAKNYENIFKFVKLHIKYRRIFFRTRCITPNEGQIIIIIIMLIIIAIFNTLYYSSSKCFLSKSLLQKLIFLKLQKFGCDNSSALSTETVLNFTLLIH